LDEVSSPADGAAPADQAEAAATPGFAELGLSENVVRAVADAGYTTPTPIQAQAIPYVLMGRDVLGVAQTGTGKTAGFTLPMLDIMAGGRARARMPRALILEPTRELAAQVGENFVKYTKYLKFEHALIIGGESMSDQVAKLQKGVDALIATPGRLIDLFERGGLLLTDVRILVIDEADRMLDMGFIPDVERIVAMLPPLRQTLFFSATMAPEIKRLADAFLSNPKLITVSKSASLAPTVTAGLAIVRTTDKREALRRLLRTEDVKNALIFCNRKRDVDILFKSLSRHGFNVGALHGDMTQPKRTETLEKFKAAQIDLLVCSDVAARGLDIGGLSHVFNFDVPHHAEDYVHRIGRTGRAGREGRAFTLGTVDEEKNISAIEKLTGKRIPRIEIEGLDAVDAAAEPREAPRRGRGGRTRAPEAKQAETKPKPPVAAAEDAVVGRARPRRRSAAPSAAVATDEVIEAVAPAPEFVAEAEALPADTAPDDVAPPPPAAIEDARPPRPARGRGRGRDRGAEPREAATAPAADLRIPSRPERNDRDRGRAQNRPEGRDGPDSPVVGFGDAMPAFMLLRARPSAPPHDSAADEADDAQDSEAA
jgi:superfamily II DNA/RNA helicase